MSAIIGRRETIHTLAAYQQSSRPEFIAIYGRRRVGKTYLVEQLYADQFVFSTSGIIDGTRDEQFFNFTTALRRYGYQAKRTPSTWLEAFDVLRTLIESRPLQQGRRSIIFIDELPCFDTPRSGFVRALGNFWNLCSARRPDLMLIVCGSATSWMIKNIVDNRGGLHNRITHEIHLQPFTLAEVDEYLTANGFHWEREGAVRVYMTLGGVPYYLSLLDRSTSLAQNIDRLYFAPDGELRREYARLYGSLFNAPEAYMQVIELLAKHQQGLTRDQISKMLAIPANGHLSERIEDLLYCDFIRRYQVKARKVKQKDAIYQLTDFFTLFHLTFMRSQDVDAHFWTMHQGTPLVNTWMGFAFERVCMAHVPQLKRALGIDRISTQFYSWRSQTEGQQAQIDLILERADQIVHLCEIKFCQAPYVITRDEDLRLRTRADIFRRETGTRYAIFQTFITPYGLAPNAYSAQVEHSLTLDDLFA